MGALTAVLGGLPEDLPAALVAQQHLGAHDSMLADILGRRTDRAVVWARAGLLLRPGDIVVCPPGKRLEVRPDSTCRLHESPRGALDSPHDRLLCSLAVSFGARALAVVLSGLGRDGAAGTAALKAVGAIVVAQDSDTARYSPMPEAAAAAGADLVVPLQEIAGVVTAVVGASGRNGAPRVHLQG